MMPPTDWKLSTDEPVPVATPDMRRLAVFRNGGLEDMSWDERWKTWVASGNANCKAELEPGRAVLNLWWAPLAC